jgi:glutathione S-transferase
MDATLYTMEISNPGWSARMAFARKGIEPRVVNFPAGMHPALLWVRGYRRGTVPSARIDGRRVEGSLQIVQELERLVPEPSLYPADPSRRAAVEEAERWGESVLQGLPRSIARYAIAHDHATRTWFMREHAGMPLPTVAATIGLPAALAMAARADGGASGARRALDQLPEALDRVDRLLADGLLGEADGPNAAGVQIAPSVALLAGLTDLADHVEGRPGVAWARTLLPDFPTAPSSQAIVKLRNGG